MNADQLRFRPQRALVLTAIAVAAFAFAGCGKSGTDAATTDAQGCVPAEQPTAKTAEIKKPTAKLDPKKTYTVDFQTNCGDFSVALDVKNNPVTAGSFANLVEQKFYDNTWFHRIISGFVVQGGDPLGDGTGDAGYNVTEKPTGGYKVGTVAMAKTGTEPAGTSSSQFYIVIGAQGTALPPDYAIAGAVNSGQDVVDKIAGYASADESGTPTGVALIKGATIRTSN